MTHFSNDATETKNLVSIFELSLLDKYSHLELDEYFESVRTTLAPTAKTKDVYNALILSALDRVSNQDLNDIIGLQLSDWIYVARDALKLQMYGEAVELSYTELVSMMVDKGLYDERLKAAYTLEELDELNQCIDHTKDELFDYAGLKSLYDRYLIRDKETGVILETPQTRFMTIAAYLMMDEVKDLRIRFVKDMYWALSNLLLTVATPTLANAGKPHAQLASCQIITTEDSLRGIYDDLTDVASFSKHGAGLGVYVGKLRAKDSDIRGHKGVSSGVIPWIKGLDNTAVSVNQLGVRNGAISVWLDIWHRDIFDFIDLRLNTGDLSKRAHNVFPGLCIPDIFWQRVEARETFTLFDPHEVKTVMGFSLEDFYDAEKADTAYKYDYEKHKFSAAYVVCEDAALQGKLKNVRTVPALDIVKAFLKASIETGVPYTMNRDTVNRLNPNGHAGMIYSSNLCTEILQNQSPSSVREEVIEDGTIIITKTAGDLVTCNLSSLVLNRIVKLANTLDVAVESVLSRVIKSQMRALDNVVSLNNLPVPAATITNKRYRAVGSGQQGIAALLAYEGIDWDSKEAVEYIDHLQFIIHQLTITASSELAYEKGSYPLFKGSDWDTGAYFDKRPVKDEYSFSWDLLKSRVMQNGMRNAYVFATAPTGSTGIIAGSTPSIDPIFDYVYYEKKKNFVIPVILPDLNFETLQHYKPTGIMEFEGEAELAQMWAILHNEARGKYIDQASSFNIYITDDIKAKNLLRLHLECWKRGIKTTYYTRSKQKPIQTADCVACSA